LMEEGQKKRAPGKKEPVVQERINNY
jgi:hypothetical protein